MGLFNKLIAKATAYGEKQSQQNKANATAGRQRIARDTIRRLYHVNPESMGESEKRALKKKIQDSIVKSISSKISRRKRDKTILAKIRHEVTSEYGVDKELLSEINDSLLFCRDDRMSEAVEISDASQEVCCIIADVVSGPIIEELEKEFHELVDGKVIKFGYGDGDEGIITYEMTNW